jgi:nitronate monooxygenase
VSFTDRLGLRHPIVQAGMGGGISGGELAGAVSAAGGLGTVGTLAADVMQAELSKTREFAGDAPVAANLLVPFAKRAHVTACHAGGAKVVVLHGGFDGRLVRQLKDGGTVVLQTVGTPEQARWALAQGSDGLVVQGREAGGHLLGVEPALEALARVREAARDVPLLLAGGIADGADVRRALEAGADAVVAGTRFLLTDECAAHPEYKRRVLDAHSTLETELFGLAWPMRHRVVPNAATDRWCRNDPLGPRAVRAIHRVSAPLARLPMSALANAIRTQVPAIPLFGPPAPLRGQPDRLVDASALYAGESALRIDSVLPAAEAVRQLASGGGEAARESPTIRSS